MKNPVVLDSHNLGSFGEDAPRDPIGKVLDIRTDGDRTEADIQFTSKEENPNGYQKFLLYKGGFLRAFSVGLRVIQQEGKKVADETINYLTKTQLLELSAVSVPANPNALVKSFKSGYISKEFMEQALQVSKQEEEQSDIINSMDEKQFNELKSLLEDVSKKQDENKTFLTEMNDTILVKMDGLQAPETEDGNTPEEEKAAEEAEIAEAEAEGYQAGLEADDEKEGEDAPKDEE